MLVVGWGVRYVWYVWGGRVRYGVGGKVCISGVRGIVGEGKWTHLTGSLWFVKSIGLNINVLVETSHKCLYL